MSGTVSTLAHRAISDPTLRGNARAWAMPYLSALTSCRSVNDYYGADDARGMLAYALGNVSTWRGETARAWKADAREMLAHVCWVDDSTCADCGGGEH